MNSTVAIFTNLAHFVMHRPKFIAPTDQRQVPTGGNTVDRRQIPTQGKAVSTRQAPTNPSSHF